MVAIFEPSSAIYRKIKSVAIKVDISQVVAKVKKKIEFLMFQC